MAEPLEKKIVKGQTTFRLTLTPDPRSAVLLCKVVVETPGFDATSAGAVNREATFKLTRDELTPIVMAFLMGG
jgi:hypothetical protein